MDIKAITPWMKYSERSYYRWSIKYPKFWTAELWDRYGDGAWECQFFPNDMSHPVSIPIQQTLESAMKAMDATLIIAGYKLLTNEQYEKMMVLI